MPAAETWDLRSGRHDGEPGFVRGVCVCICVCDEREDVRGSARERAQRNTHSLRLCGGVRV